MSSLESAQTPPTRTARLITLIRATWLSRRPHPESAIVAGLATGLLLLGSLIGWSDSPWAQLVPASAQDVFKDGQYWRLWTTILAHGDLAHLLSNAFLFFVLGFFLYGYFGAFVFPFAAFFWGGVANLIVLRTYDPDIKLIGASGVVYWMGGAWIALYFFLSRQKNLWHRCLRSLGAAILLFFPAETFQPNVSHRTHLAGFSLGVLFGVYYYFRHRTRFQQAEVKDTTIEEVDPGDDLPGPEGFPIHSGESRTALDPLGSWLKAVDHTRDLSRDPPRESLAMLWNPASIRLTHNDSTKISEYQLEQPLRITLDFVEASDGIPRLENLPLEIRGARLAIETMTMISEWPVPFRYDGEVVLHITFYDQQYPTIVRGRGLQIATIGPGRVRPQSQMND